MKKLIFPIICIFLFFSNNFVFANTSDGLIENTLNLRYWPTIYNLSLEKLKTYNFKDTYLKNAYQDMKKYDQIIRTQIISEYQNNAYDYNTMNGIIKNYKSFVYYTNRLFYSFSLAEKNKQLNNDPEFQYSIMRNYSQINTYYSKVKNLLSKRNETFASAKQE